MNKRSHRLLSNPFKDDSDLTELFGNLNLNTVQKQPRMEEFIARIEAQMSQSATSNATRIAALIATNTEFPRKLNQLELTQATFQQQSNVTVTEYTNVEPLYANGNEI